MKEVSIRGLPGDWVEILRPGKHTFGLIEFEISKTGDVRFTFPKDIVSELNPGEKLDVIRTVNQYGHSMALHIYDTSVPSHLPEEVVAELKANSDPSNPFKPVDKDVVRGIREKQFLARFWKEVEARKLK